MGKQGRRLAMAALGATLIAAATLTQTGAALSQTAPETQLAAGVRIMPLGDSITDGFNVPGGYRIELSNLLAAGGYTVDFVGSSSNGPAELTDREHEGHSGWRIDQLDTSIVAWLQTYTPQTVLLHIGTNDVIQNIDLANAPARLAQLIDKITSTVPTAQVFVASITPLTDAAQEARVQTYNAAIPGVVQAAGQNVHFVDMHAALTVADLADGIHPSATGYAKMARVWYAALQSVPGSLGVGATPTPTSTSPATPSISPSSSPSASLSSSPSAGVTPTSTPAPAGACTATYSLIGQWSGGFQAAVRVTAGGGAMTGWSVSWAPTGYSVSSIWGAAISTSGSAITARNVGYNGTLSPGASTEFGFVGSGTPASSAALSCTAG